MREDKNIVELNPKVCVTLVELEQSIRCSHKAMLDNISFGSTDFSLPRSFKVSPGCQHIPLLIECWGCFAQG